MDAETKRSPSVAVSRSYEVKDFTLAEVKTIDNGQPGEFEAIVAVFDNVDHGGDRMKWGAFDRTLAEKGMPPVVWSHEWGIPPIGAISEAYGRPAKDGMPAGLYVKGRLFVGPDEDHAVAKQAHAAMKGGALKEFSFGYATKASNDVEEDGKSIREITDVDLFEVGPTLKGMNPATRLVAVKALERHVLDEAKAGRVLSKANEDRLAEASRIITDVLAQVASDEPKAGHIAGPGEPPDFKITPTSQAEPAKEKEPADNPPPNDTPVSEEEAARIGLLLTHRPIQPHHERTRP